MPPRSSHVALIGGANLDISAHSHAPLVAADSNPGRIACSPGGVARNVAENLLRLGVDARLLSVLADDPFGQLLRQSAAQIGLNLDACVTLPGERTATYLSLHDGRGEMDVAVNDMAILEHLTPQLLSAHSGILEAAAALMVDCNVRPDVLAWVAQSFAKRPIFAEAVSVAKCTKLLPVMAALHTLKVNSLEAAALSGLPVTDIDSAHAAAKALQQLGVQNVVISMGPVGAVWRDAWGASGHCPAQPLDMDSATGAGDALMGGLIYGHLHGMPLERAIPWAMACAEITLSSTFANSPELSVAAVRARLNLSSQ